VKFVWDPAKAASNRRKHGVTFQEAASCFADPKGCYFRNDTQGYEDRLILIAFSQKARILFVVHAEVGRDAIRIISARKASRQQSKLYRLG
jgi:uncharacterized DUF497 family protein